MNFVVMVSQAASVRIREGGEWGCLTYRISDVHQAAAVAAVGHGNSAMVGTPTDSKRHFLSSEIVRGGHRWYRVSPELHLLWWSLRNRPGTSMRLSAFRDAVPNGWQHPGGLSQLVVTYAPDVEPAWADVGIPELAAWRVTSDGVAALETEVQPATAGFAQLDPHWPVGDLANSTVLVVGVGSIGAAAANALASYGIGRLVVVDPDRLRWHNLVRHLADSRHVGMHKVHALQRHLELHWPQTRVDPHTFDAVHDADRLRPLLDDCDVVLCAADGVAPRRVVGHLARRASVCAMLACVLEDGMLGEIIRLHPWTDHGCLTCRRETLIMQGAFDPEPGIDAGYGTGTTHRPMTAVAGDLHLVGQLAAKTIISTILERAGHAGHTLSGEHLTIALRPLRTWPDPINLPLAGTTTWLPAYPPVAGCPTCEPA